MKKVLLVSAITLGGIAIGLMVKKYCPICSGECKCAKCNRMKNN